jgi:hypothetical protein
MTACGAWLPFDVSDLTWVISILLQLDERALQYGWRSRRHGLRSRNARRHRSWQVPVGVANDINDKPDPAYRFRRTGA